MFNHETPPAKYPIKIFVSYSSRDRELRELLVTGIKGHLATRREYQYECWTDKEITGGAAWEAEINAALEGCNVALLLVDSHFVSSGYILSEELPKLLAKKTEETLILPILLRSFNIQEFELLSGLQFFKPYQQDYGFNSALERHKLLPFDKLAESQNVSESKLNDYYANLAEHIHTAVCKKFSTQKENKVIASSSTQKSSQVVLLHEMQVDKVSFITNILKQQGYTVVNKVFFEKTTLEQADYVLVILSPQTLYSESLLEKVAATYQITLQNGNKPLLVGLYIDGNDSIPQSLVKFFSPHLLITAKSTELATILTPALFNPEQVVRPYELEMVGGAIPLESKFYVERDSDSELANAIKRRDSIVLLKGARQVGKTSLLARGVQMAKKDNALVLLTDFQKLVSADFNSAEALFIALGSLMADQLGLDVYPQDKWRKERSPNINFDLYMRREILGKTEHNVVWVMDEADKLLGHSFSDDIFALFRTWHNERALSPDEPCRRLTLVLAYATEPYLFIKDLNQSPFNVGTKITLCDFNEKQVADLNQRYGLPIKQHELEDFYCFTGGHPYLVRSALNDMVVNALSYQAFLQKITRDEGVFADHLRRITMVLKRDEALLVIVKQFLRENIKPAYDAFFRLHSAGVLSGTHENPYFRCQVYEQYLRKALLG